jgi:hypothetical protein
MNREFFIDKYFPNGCEICRGPVELNEERYVYKCAVCGAFVSAHRSSSEYAEKFEPKGYLASKEINIIRGQLTKAMESLYKSNGTSKPLISSISKDFYVELIINSDKPVYGKYEGKSMFDTNLRIVKDINNGTIHELRDDQWKTISYRTKTYIWLSTQLKMDVNACKIKLLDVIKLKEALRIVNSAINYENKKINY